MAKSRPKSGSRRRGIPSDQMRCRVPHRAVGACARVAARVRNGSRACVSVRIARVRVSGAVVARVPG